MRVALLDSMGSDLTVVNAARVSFAKRHEAMDESDERLIGYLARNGHWTPFAHCTASFHVTAPIFVARQLVKHQIGLSWNEVSRRYVDSEPEFWEPEAWRERAANAKQGSGAARTFVIPCADRETTPAAILTEICDRAQGAYDMLLSVGVCPEQARAVLPLATMTEWHWTGSLAAWARVCRLRCAPEAQAESREIAEQIAAHCARLWPVSWAALMDL